MRTGSVHSRTLLFINATLGKQLLFQDYKKKKSATIGCVHHVRGGCVPIEVFVTLAVLPASGRSSFPRASTGTISRSLDNLHVTLKTGRQQNVQSKGYSRHTASSSPLALWRFNFHSQLLLMDILKACGTLEHSG